MQAGVSGERGEAWAAAQVGILVFVLLGNLPFLGGSLEIIAGPGLLLGGAGLALVSECLQRFSLFALLFVPPPFHAWGRGCKAGS